MSAQRRVYMDHAATSWPKSDAVLKAMDQFARDCGAAAGRGGYRSAAAADQVVQLARRTIATQIDAGSSDCISFHANGTTALNAAIYGLLRPGDHVVASAAEHNSVLRPLHDMEVQHQVRLSIVPTDQDGRVHSTDMISAIEKDTRMVALTHASNVTGAVQPIEEIGRYLGDHRAVFLCDAAQTFGTIPISVRQSNIDLLAAPGHKSSGGPLGTAFLYTAPQLHEQMTPWMRGGTGSRSESMDMPQAMPEKLEAGNLNVPAIAGWNAALQDCRAETWNQRIQHARTLAARMHAGLAALDNVHVHGQPGILPIASLTIDHLAPGDAAAILDAEYGIEARAGMHCAAMIHRHLGTHPEGTLRISAGHTSKETEIDHVIEALSGIVSAMHSH